MARRTRKPSDSGYVHSLNKQHFFAAASVHRVRKEWGEEQWIVNKEYCGKKLVLKKNRRCSLHMHKQKDEVFYILSGLVKLEVGGKVHRMNPGDFVHIKQGQEHRFTGLEDSEIMEFSTTHDDADSFRRELSGHTEPERFLRQSALLDAFASKKILVIGDVMLDRYVSGTVTRISPEAPVPIVHASKEWETVGGAANSAHNVRILGAKVTLIGVVGKDSAARRMRDLCKAQKISTKFFANAATMTIQKERIVNQAQQQIVRIDREDASDVSSTLERSLIKSLPSACKGMDAIIVSDYAKGLLTPKVLRAIIAEANKKKISLIIDPKPRAALSVDMLKGATLLTPNIAEARALLGQPHGEAEKMGQQLSTKTQATVLLTRGAEGLDVYRTGKRITHLAAHSADVVDVSGAGDTVSAVAALCLASGASIEDIADISNRAAGVVVSKRGTATLTLDELRAAL